MEAMAAISNRVLIDGPEANKSFMAEFLGSVPLHGQAFVIVFPA
ncbi:MAG: hypothetical protein ACU84H_06750 [Gammaproteobacteria bacterium]